MLSNIIPRPTRSQCCQYTTGAPTLPASIPLGHPPSLPTINKANALLYCCTHRFAECSLDEESSDTGEDEGPNSNQAVLHGFGHFEHQQNLALEVGCRLVIYCGRLSADRKEKNVIWIAAVNGWRWYWWTFDWWNIVIGRLISSFF